MDDKVGEIFDYLESKGLNKRFRGNPEAVKQIENKILPKVENEKGKVDEQLLDDLLVYGITKYSESGEKSKMRN